MDRRPPSQSQRQRAMQRAATAWNNGRPHEAWQHLADAGMTDDWVTFQRTAHRIKRREYLAHMARYST